MNETRNHVYGVDFSGAKSAGKNIWIAGGVIQDDTLRIDTCRRADSLPNSSRRRDECLAALHAFIVDKSESGIFRLADELGFETVVFDELDQDDPTRAYVNLGQDCVMMPSRFPPGSNAWRDGVDEWGRVWQGERSLSSPLAISGLNWQPHDSNCLPSSTLE